MKVVKLRILSRGDYPGLSGELHVREGSKQKYQESEKVISEEKQRLE